VIFRRLILIGVVTAWLVVGGVADSHAQSLSSREYEYQVKVAFIYNLSRFVEWPDETFPSGSSSLTVCVLGNNPFGGALDTIKGKNVKDKKIEIKLLTSGSKLDACHILFISSSERESLTQILESAKNSSVLTIGEMSQFTRAGGIIALAMRKNRIRFSVNLDAGKRAGLVISSQLLKLADSVVQ
jgi:hypothetical protein